MSEASGTSERISPQAVNDHERLRRIILGLQQSMPKAPKYIKQELAQAMALLTRHLRLDQQMETLTKWIQCIVEQDLAAGEPSDPVEVCTVVCNYFGIWKNADDRTVDSIPDWLMDIVVGIIGEFNPDKHPSGPDQLDGATHIAGLMGMPEED